MMAGYRPRLFLRLLAALATLAALSPAQSFRFVILGDRTGEAQPGVYQQAWREAAAEKPAFVLTVGDTIQGLRDATAEREWQELERTLAPFRQLPRYLAPGNHDIWSERSERLFRKYTGRAPHYSFNHKQAHFTILDNSRSEHFAAAQLEFLAQDLRVHAAQPVKFIVSHRPSWLLHAMFGNTDFELHQLARKYGVRQVIAGHVHKMLHLDLEGISYISMASSGGQLRASKQYDDGWFFAYMLVEVNGESVSMQVRELKAPHGEGRVSKPADWGVAGQVKR